MSNRKWRTPPAGDSNKPAHHVDAGATPAQADAAEPAPTATSGAELRAEEPEHIARRRLPGPGPELAALPDDYLENGYGGAPPEIPPGCYRTAFRGGAGMPDLRMTVRGVSRTGPLNDAEVEAIARDTVRFLRQVVLLTSGVLETVEAGALRRAVAAESAMPGDVVLEDGSVSHCRDAYRVNDDARVENGSADCAEATSPGGPGEQPAGPAPANVKNAHGPRGATHPLVALLRLAVQAARLIKQITSGTHPGVFNRLKREPKGPYEYVLDGEKALRSMLNGT
ncbi:MAG: hypothetical protein KDB90_12265 [Planctomycetes bacterium]|nr:hypothetical protein [Planctomycetota bacterium]